MSTVGGTSGIGIPPARTGAGPAGVDLSTEGDSVMVWKSGEFCALVPDVCRTPAPPAPFIPIPYPNTAPAPPEGTKAVKVKSSAVSMKGSNYKMAPGNEPGTSWAVVSFADSQNGLILVDALITKGFTPMSAKRLVRGLPVESPQDQSLLCAILARSGVKRSTAKSTVMRRPVP